MLLADHDKDVVDAVVEVLGCLPPEEMARFAKFKSMSQSLFDVDDNVSLARSVGAPAFMPFLATVEDQLLRLEHSNPVVRRTVVKVLRKLPTEELVKVVPQLLTQLEHSDPIVRRTVKELLCKLPTEELVKVVPQLISTPKKQQIVLDAIQYQQEEEIAKEKRKALAAKRAERLVALLKDQDAGVRKLAVQKLGQIGKAAAPHASEIAKLLRDSDMCVRQSAVDVLHQLDKTAMFAEEIVPLLKDKAASVRKTANAALGSLKANRATM